MENDKPIKADFPFESKYIDVLGSKIHYIEEGEGDPILFLHGNPTSSYLWRNIIPYLIPHGRCIAPDLIGMGKSDKPDIAYRFKDHYKYLKAFIETMNLSNVTLVIHDWGSGLGFHYAMSNESNIKAIAFMESILGPSKWSQFPSEFRLGFRLMRTPYLGWFMISVMNIFVNQILPQATHRKLTNEEMKRYREPYPTVKSRKPVRQWPCEIPIEGKPEDMHQIVSAYRDKLKQSDVPKLLLYAMPGALITKEAVEWCRENLSNLQTVELGEGLHFVQETHPHKIGQAVQDWYLELG